MPRIKHAMGANGGHVQVDSAGHVMVTAPIGSNGPTPHSKVIAEP